MHESVFIIPHLCERKIEKKLHLQFLRLSNTEKITTTRHQKTCINHEVGNMPCIQKLVFLFSPPIADWYL